MNPQEHVPYLTVLRHIVTTAKPRIQITLMLHYRPIQNKVVKKIWSAIMKQSTSVTNRQNCQFILYLNTAHCTVKSK